MKTKSIFGSITTSVSTLVALTAIGVNAAVQETPLIAGQHFEAGTVTLEDDGFFLYVTYSTFNGWTIDAVHLAVANTLQDIPQTKAGNPKVGRFPYSATGGSQVTEIAFVVPLALLDTDEPVVAAHAVVRRCFSGDDDDTEHHDGEDSECEEDSRGDHRDDGREHEDDDDGEHHDDDDDDEDDDSCRVETAWGLGTPFPGKNWAMYIETGFGGPGLPR